jgi:hypothetical protein
LKPTNAHIPLEATAVSILIIPLDDSSPIPPELLAEKYAGE